MNKYIIRLLPSLAMLIGAQTGKNTFLKKVLSFRGIRSIIYAIVLFLAIAFFTSEQVLAQSYNITDLGTFGATSSEATQINDAGEIIVETSTANGNNFYLDANDSTTGLTSLGSLSSTGSYVVGINSSGEVVGNIIGSNGDYVPVVYSNGSNTTLPVLSNTYDSQATGINDSGQVVGLSLLPNNGQNVLERPFLYSGGATTDPGMYPTSSNTVADGINNSGQIIGVD